MYITTNKKYIISLLFSLLWVGVSIWIAQWWIEDLSQLFTRVGAWMVLAGIALLPGMMNAFIIASLLLDRRPKLLDPEFDYKPEITILIAAYNEEDAIGDTIKSIQNQNYPNINKIIVVDDGSKDKTSEIVAELSASDDRIKLVKMIENSGKARALNNGLIYVETEILVTIDADCYLYKNSLRNLVGRYLADPPSAAIAGTVMVRNSRHNIVTKIQEWDYFHGIAAIKRIQSLYQGTLVAQGAYTLFKTDIVKELGGWKHSVGEDIVLTWELLEHGHRVGYAENAVAFTNVPTTWKNFIKQRMRWARGIFEAIKNSPKILLKVRKTQLFIWWNVSFLYIDILYTFVFIPGIIAALLFQNFLIAGPITLIVIPLGLMINYIMYYRSNQMFREQGLCVRSNPIGFLCYAILYSIILQPASTLGYLKEIFNSKKSWGTK